MGLTVHILTPELVARRAVPANAITELVHSEGDGKLTAEWDARYAIETGELVGLRCVDGRYRAFTVTLAEVLEDEATVQVTAMDAARQEIASTVVVSAKISGRKVQDAVMAAIGHKGWGFATVTADGTVGEVQEPEFETADVVLQKIADTAGVEIIPYYEIMAGGMGKKLDILPRDPVYRGQIISAGNASGIVMTQDGAPMLRVYPMGKATGAADQRAVVTVRDVAWSKANGDPVDKPAGQEWIQIGEGTRAAEYVYKDPQQEDAQALAREAYEDLLERAEGKRSGTAKAADLALIPGHQLRMVSVGDLVGIRSRYGEPRGERVANIRRDYIRPDQTLLEFGEREDRDWITNQVQQVTQAISGSGGFGSRLSGMENTIEENVLELYQAVEQLVELETGTATQFNEVWIDLNALNAQIQLKANSSTVNELEERVSSAEVLIDGINASVTLQASQINTLEGETEELSAQLVVQAGQISTKVEQNGVISAINQTAESITIQASKINLSGYVTASQLNAAIADIWAAEITLINATTIGVQTLTASHINTRGLYFADRTISRLSTTVSTPSGDRTIYYLGYQP